jgi:hypothetical protein
MDAATHASDGTEGNARFANPGNGLEINQKALALETADRCLQPTDLVR